MDDGVWIVGGCQSDFARNLTKEGCDFATLTGAVVHATLPSAQMESAEVGVVHVANASTLNFGGSNSTTVSFVVSTVQGF